MSTLEEKLVHMAKHGQSVMLNWGEDNDLWECSWITGGKRYTSFDKYPTMAVVQCRLQAARVVGTDAIRRMEP